MMECRALVLISEGILQKWKNFNLKNNGEEH